MWTLTLIATRYITVLQPGARSFTVITPRAFITGVKSYFTLVYFTFAKLNNLLSQGR